MRKLKNATAGQSGSSYARNRPFEVLTETESLAILQRYREFGLEFQPGVVLRQKKPVEAGHRRWKPV